MSKNGAPFTVTSSDEIPTSDDCFVGIEIGGTKLQVVVGTATGRILDRHRFSVVAAAGAEGIRSQLASALPALVLKHRPRAVGVGYGGPVNWRTGRVVKSYHVPGWQDFPLGAWLSELTGVPVFPDNDANIAALGEALAGAGRGCSPVFYVTVGSGVGGGLVHEGRIFHGFVAGEAEIGHLRLDSTGITPEDCCSGWSLDRRIREAVSESPGGDLARRVTADPGNEARHLSAALASGDALANQVLDEAVEKLALALSHSVHLFHPEVIVLGGGVSLLGEPFRAAVAKRLRRFVMDAFQPGPRVVLASLREDAVPVGALAFAAQRYRSANEFNPQRTMQTWFQTYIAAQHKALDSVSLDDLNRLTETVRGAWLRDAQIFAIGNGGSAANASHFATDLGKGSSDKVSQRFRVLSLTDNVSWLTALGNDYSYDDAFVRQLQNYARSGDLLLAASVSGNSPNLVKAFEWANDHGMETVAIVGAKRGRLAEISRQTIVIDDTHYGRVEDVQMHILHMLCYAFMEVPELART